MEDNVAKIKSKLDIVDVINSYVNLKKSGRNFKAVCPFHNEKTPSFMVSRELQIYKCFGCGAAGDMFNFVEAIEGVDFPRALEILADKAGVKLVKSEAYDSQNKIKKKIYDINEIAAKFYQYVLLKKKIGVKALKYLEKDRDIKKDSIKNFRLGYAPDSWDTLSKFLRTKGYKDEELVLSGVAVKRSSGKGIIDKFRGRIMFPLVGTDGKVLGFTGRTLFDRKPKYLNTSETPVFHKSYFVYGLDKSKVEIKKEGVVFVEGQTDVISAHQVGIKNVVCISGTALTGTQLDILSRYTQDIVFCFDSDFAGVEASYRAIEMAEKRNFNVKVAVIPDPFKDLDELIKADSSKAKKVIKNPIPVYDYFIATSLERNNKETALGKKTIMEELVPIFSKISNQVLFDHYAKKISSELDISEETAFSMLRKGKTDEKEDYSELEEIDQKFPLRKRKVEGYLISLFLKAPLEKVKESVKKLEPEDFLNEKVSEIFVVLQKYIKDRKSDINIKTLMNKFDEETQELLSELYLWDVDEAGEVEDMDKEYERELDDLVDRIKKESVKRQLQILSDEIKIAETKKEDEELKRLTKKFEKLSKSLL
jgi:DNA primase